MNTIAEPLQMPTRDECSMATLAHALQVLGGWIAPLIIFLVKRESKFVAFHALQALLLQVCNLVLLIVLGGAWFVVIIGVVGMDQAAHGGRPPIGVFLVLPLLWLGFMAAWVAVLLIAILYAIKAGRGEWAEYPVVGRWAKRILRIDATARTS